MAEFNKELWKMAKRANSAEEFLALAKEIDVELTQEQAETFFGAMNESNELPDDELNNVVGGEDLLNVVKPIINPNDSCELWICIECRWGREHYLPNFGILQHSIYCGVGETCQFCLYCSDEGGLLYCDNPKKQIIKPLPEPTTQWR